MAEAKMTHIIKVVDQLVEASIGDLSKDHKF